MLKGRRLVMLPLWNNHILIVHVVCSQDGVGKAQIAALKLQVAHLERQLAQARAHEESLEAQIVEMQSSTRVPMDQLENAEVAHAVCAKRIQELEEQVKKQTVLIESYVCQARAQLGMVSALFNLIVGDKWHLSIIRSLKPVSVIPEPPFVCLRLDPIKIGISDPYI